MKNKIISSFTLGYFLCLLTERLDDDFPNKENTSEKIFLLYKEEILSQIQNFYYESFNEPLFFDRHPKSSFEFFSALKGLFESIKEKNHWGDDSFLKTAFFSGSFLCLVESFDDERCDLSMFQQILMELVQAINVNIDYREFSQTIMNIKSKIITDRICSRDEIFHIISGHKSNHHSISNIQFIIDNPAVIQSFTSA